MRILIPLALALSARAALAAETPIFDVAIELARRDHPKLDQAKVGAEIDRLAARYRMLAAKDPVDAFRQLLFVEEKFKSVQDLQSAEHLHIDTVLATKKGYCLSLSVVALAIAERVNAPLVGIATPNHFLVRLGKSHYIELTRKGVAVKLGDLPEDSIYGKPLTANDVRAYLLHNRGYVAMLRLERAKAQADFEAAIKLQPGIGEAHRNLGVVLGEQHHWKKAKASFVRAYAINPGDTRALVNLAICRYELGDKVAALQELEMVLAMDPDRKSARDLKALWTSKKRPPAPVEPLPEAPEGLQPGLRVRYYRDTKLRTVVAESIDRELDFDWKNNAPHGTLPRDQFSVRWDGYFKAPVTGEYTFFVVANDGVRLTVAGRSLIDDWRARGTENLFEHKVVRLAAGWHRIRVEHFDQIGGARLMLRIGVEGRDRPLPHADHLFHVR